MAIDPTVLARYILTEMKNRGISKIEVIGHRKSKYVQLNIYCDNEESYKFILERLSMLQDIEKGLETVLSENKDKIAEAVQKASRQPQ